MQWEINRKYLLAFVLTVVALSGLACQQTKTANAPVNTEPSSNQIATIPPSDVKPPTMTDYPVGNAKTPSEAYRMLFAAVKSQDSSKIKSMLSQGSMGLAEMAAGQQKKPVEDIIRNGFTETSFADTMPKMRDERIKGGYGAVEVWNTTRKQWDDVPFILEGGSWKAAFGEQFNGKWQSPGKGQAILEQEAANAKNPNLVPYGNQNANTNVKVQVPKPQGK